MHAEPGTKGGIQYFISGQFLKYTYLNLPIFTFFYFTVFLICSAALYHTAFIMFNYTLLCLYYHGILLTSLTSVALVSPSSLTCSLQNVSFRYFAPTLLHLFPGNHMKLTNKMSCPWTDLVCLHSPKGVLNESCLPRLSVHTPALALSADVECWIVGLAQD